MAKTKKRRSPEKLAAIQKIVKQVELRELRFTGCQVHFVPFTDKPPEVLTQQIQISAGVNKATNEMRFVITITLSGGMAAGSDEVPSLMLTAIFTATYGVQSLEGIKEETVTKFGQVNGLFNVWPLWREFVMNMLGRLGLPSLIIPLMNKPMEFSKGDAQSGKEPETPQPSEKKRKR